jgi:glycosyltransferase involved in cell wall biosynthesis
LVEDGVTGFLVPPKNPELMADRICEFLERPVLRATIGGNARQRIISIFSEKSVLAKYDALYTRLAARH